MKKEMPGANYDTMAARLLEPKSENEKRAREVRRKITEEAGGDRFNVTRIETLIAAALAQVAEAAETKVKELETEARTWRSPQQILRLEAEAICQSLIDQSSRWEAQALEAGVRIAELEALFALQQTRMAEATRVWQAATGKLDVLPDLGDLLAWLMVRATALEAQVRGLREAGRKAGEGGIAAADELMTEFVSKQRAANWGVINKGLLACQSTLAEAQEEKK